MSITLDNIIEALKDMSVADRASVAAACVGGKAKRSYKKKGSDSGSVSGSETKRDPTPWNNFCKRVHAVVKESGGKLSGPGGLKLASSIKKQYKIDTKSEDSFAEVTDEQITAAYEESSDAEAEPTEEAPVKPAAKAAEKPKAAAEKPKAAAEKPKAAAEKPKAAAAPEKAAAAVKPAGKDKKSKDPVWTEEPERKVTIGKISYIWDDDAEGTKFLWTESDNAYAGAWINGKIDASIEEPVCEE
jgi:hypothetical protein